MVAGYPNASVLLLLKSRYARLAESANRALKTVAAKHTLHGRAVAPLLPTNTRRTQTKD